MPPRRVTTPPQKPKGRKVSMGPLRPQTKPRQPLMPSITDFMRARFQNPFRRGR